MASSKLLLEKVKTVIGTKAVTYEFWRIFSINVFKLIINMPVMFYK